MYVLIQCCLKVQNDLVPFRLRPHSALRIWIAATLLVDISASAQLNLFRHLHLHFDLHPPLVQHTYLHLCLPLPTLSPRFTYQTPTSRMLVRPFLLLTTLLRSLMFLNIIRCSWCKIRGLWKCMFPPKRLIQIS